MPAEKITIHVDAAEKRADLPDCGSTDGACPHCGARLETGFGLAGGGYGVYEYCPNETCSGEIIGKTTFED